MTGSRRIKGGRMYPVEKKRANGRAAFDGVGLMTWKRPIDAECPN
jgi:hypothetical protein